VEFKRTPQCSDCIPALRDDNREAMWIWQVTENQVIVGGMGAVIGINQLAVWKAIEMYRAKDPVKVFEKVLRLFQEVTWEGLKSED